MKRYLVVLKCLMIMLCFMQVGCGYSIKNSKNIKPTNYIFHFDSGIVTIKDNYNKINKIYGRAPFKVEIIDGTRTIHFSDCVILKTNCDSIEPSNKNVKLEGYLGTISIRKEFSVDKDGIILDDNWSSL